MTANTLARAAGSYRRRADFTEGLPSVSRGNDFTELRRILVQHWVSPDGVCLFWMSYNALAKFLRPYSIPNLPVPGYGGPEERMSAPRITENGPTRGGRASIKEREKRLPPE